MQIRKLDAIKESHGAVSSVDTDGSEVGPEFSQSQQPPLNPSSGHKHVRKNLNSVYQGKSENSSLPENVGALGLEDSKDQIRVSKTFCVSPRNSGVTDSMKKSISSQGYYSNSSTSGATQGASSGALVRRPQQERSPADRLLRDVKFDAIERLASQEETRGGANMTRVTMREKRFSLFCFKWRNRYKSVFFNDGDSNYVPAKKSGVKK